jgi:glutamate-1-semialdehyde 2,1-aminomutase
MSGIPDFTEGAVSRNGDLTLARARAVTASDTWDLDRRFPIVMDSARGAHVVDSTGRQYVDFTSCSGAAPLGAGYPVVVERMVAELQRTGGILPGPVSILRIEVAERLREIFPSAQRSIFFRTGSCATTAAVRLARVATGRRTILTCGFHGWHDWHLQYRPHLALPDRDPDTFDFGYDLDRLHELARQCGDVAAVIFTPEVAIYPHEFAQKLAQATKRLSALLIVDEVMTGFRYAWGGYHRAAEIVPDIITLSKGLANGTALSCVSGRSELLRAAEHTYLGNTFQRETTPFAAAIATLDAYNDRVELERMRSAGEHLMTGLDSVFAQTGTQAWIAGVPTMFDMVFEDSALGTAFCHNMWARGFLMQYGGRFMPSAAVSRADIDRALDAARIALAEAGASAVRQSAPDHRDPARYLSAFIAYGRDNFGATPACVRSWAKPPATRAAEVSSD